jgi:predicted RNA-binding protein with PIN domain
MRYLLVDAHSVIFAWPEVLRIHQRRQEAGRDELVRRLELFHDASEYRVVAVFDGAGPSTSSVAAPESIQIFYSSGKKTADSVIERLCAKYGSEHDLTVVTNDLMERQTATTFGALTVSVETFLGWASDAERETSRFIKKHRTKRPG